MPDCQIERIMFPGTDEVEAVRQGWIDLGETPFHLYVQQSGLEYMKLIDLAYYCLLCKDHPLANQKKIRLEELRRCTVVINSRQFDRWALEEMTSTLFNFQIDDHATVMVQKRFTQCQNRAVFITPAYYSRFLSGLKAIPLDRNWRREYGIVYRKSPSALIQRYPDLAREFYAL